LVRTSPFHGEACEFESRREYYVEDTAMSKTEPTKLICRLISWSKRSSSGQGQGWRMQAPDMGSSPIRFTDRYHGRDIIADMADWFRH
jgi:hypothetical protein